MDVCNLGEQNIYKATRKLWKTGLSGRGTWQILYILVATTTILFLFMMFETWGKHLFLNNIINLIENKKQLMFFVIFKEYHKI